MKSFNLFSFLIVIFMIIFIVVSNSNCIKCETTSYINLPSYEENVTVNVNCIGNCTWGISLFGVIASLLNFFRRKTIVVFGFILAFFTAATVTIYTGIYYSGVLESINGITSYYFEVTTRGWFSVAIIWLIVLLSLINLIETIQYIKGQLPKNISC